MYKVTMEIPENTTINGSSMVNVYQSANFPIYSIETAWALFEKVKTVINALQMDDVYVNLIADGKVVSWYRYDKS